MREPTRLITQEEKQAQQAAIARVAALTDKPRSFCLVTYGCQMNVNDSQKMAHMLQEMGLSQVPDKESADLVIFNTCTIRDNAERKALSNLTWMKELKKVKPGLILAVTGCLMQAPGQKELIDRRYPFVNLAFGTGDLHRLPEMLEDVIKGERVMSVSSNPSVLYEDMPAVPDSPYQAYVSIMYGCDNFCSYCIVPTVRGRERSRTRDDILREVDQLVASGIKEITLLGQNVNSYGRGTDTDFPALLDRLSRTGIKRLRFMTSHPKDLSEALIAQYRDNLVICPHLHLPVQSGSDRVLKAMNRGYTARQYIDKVTALRAARSDMTLTTDLIVAFPGETESEFLETLQLVDTVRFASAFSFIYSPRQGTVAAGLPGRIDKDEATRRIKMLIERQDAITAEVLSGMVGQTDSVLVTGTSPRSDHVMTGKSGRNISVNFKGEAKPGDIVPVLITARGRNTLKGEKING